MGTTPDSQADRIIRARAAAGLNQSEVARALKVSPQTVQQWEKGGGIRPARLEQLAKVLGVTPELLAFGQSQKAELIPDKTGTSEAHAVRLSAPMIVDAYKGVSWAFRLAGLHYDPDTDPDLLALAILWTLDESPAQLAALRSAVDARIAERQRNQSVPAAAPSHPTPGRAPARRNRGHA